MAKSLCPVILHSNLQASAFLEYLGSGYKVRVSNSTPPDSVILPSCGVAVLVVHLSKVTFENDVNDSCNIYGYDEFDFRSEDEEAAINSLGIHPKSTDKVCVTYPQQQQKHKSKGNREIEDLEHLISRIDGFIRGHKMPVVLLVGSVFTGEDKGGKVMCHLQKNLMPSPPLILPAHGDAQIAMHIQSLSKACQQETRSLVQSRMEEITSSVINKDHSTILARAMGLNHQQLDFMLFMSS
ncbi:uncharacterized protein [Palaemon carinicauda]|uniref:uncharacterized protein isoform X3 n=1 Tax=Palaemon carinicauda TaxID=392227 RepID=UPI0035B5D302